jgi:hypothetical protein
MMCRALFVCLAFCVSAQPARAQTRIYVTGDVFAEIARFSRATSPEFVDFVQDASPGDGVTIGGGGRIGAFFTPSWSLEIGLDLGKAISEERTQSIRPLTGPIFPPAPLQYQSRSSHRFSASSVLLGYHPPARGRIQAGFRGGMSFRHTTRMFTTANASFSYSSLPTLPGGFPVLVEPRISLVTAEYTTVSHGLTATLAAEAAISVSDRFAIVPEMRAHAGGTGAIFLRPGVAVRWRW